jgi:hypothetical protein
VQLDPDDDKLFAWSLYLELGRSRYRCEGALVIITLSKAVRRWIERAIEPITGICGTRRRLQPTVIALDSIDPSLLLSPNRPYLAPLAVAGHAQSADAQRVADLAVDVTLDNLPCPSAKGAVEMSGRARGPRICMGGMRSGKPEVDIKDAQGVNDEG